MGELKNIKEYVDTNGYMELNLANGLLLCEITKKDKYTINFYSVLEQNKEWELQKTFKKTEFPPEEWFESKIQSIAIQGIMNFF